MLQSHLKYIDTIWIYDLWNPFGKTLDKMGYFYRFWGPHIKILGKKFRYEYDFWISPWICMFSLSNSWANPFKFFKTFETTPALNENLSPLCFESYSKKWWQWMNQSKLLIMIMLYRFVIILRYCLLSLIRYTYFTVWKRETYFPFKLTNRCSLETLEFVKLLFNL